MQVLNAFDAQEFLIVDDDKRICDQIIEELKENFVFSAKTANGGDEALEILRASPKIQLVITDIEMPKGGGIDFVKNARSLGFKVPFVIVSSRQRESRAVLSKFEPIQFVEKLEITIDLATKVAHILSEAKRANEQLSQSMANVTKTVEKSMQLAKEIEAEVAKAKSDSKTSSS